MVAPSLPLSPFCFVLASSLGSAFLPWLHISIEHRSLPRALAPSSFAHASSRSSSHLPLPSRHFPSSIHPNSTAHASAVAIEVPPRAAHTGVFILLLPRHSLTIPGPKTQEATHAPISLLPLPPEALPPTAIATTSRLPFRDLARSVTTRAASASCLERAAITAVIVRT